jgi:hypothetical protein
MPTILTPEQANERLQSGSNLVNRFRRAPDSSSTPSSPQTEVTIIPLHRPGRTDGSPNFTPEEKINIATRTALGESYSDVARSQETTASVVRNIDIGRTKVDKLAVEEKVKGVQDVALLKLMQSLDLIDETKLSKLGAKDLGNFASSMSKVISNTTQKDDNEAKVQIHIYAPELRSESSFKTIEVRGS